MSLELATTPFIILVVYIITQLLRTYVLKTDEKRKGLPPIAGAFGGLIGILLFIFVPDSMSESANIVQACTTGMASGLAAVGCNQVYKQFKKFSSTDDTSADE